LELNPLTQLQRDLQSDPSYLDFVSSDFHNCGLILPKEIMIPLFSDYGEKRHYKPQSKGDLIARKAISDFYAKQNSLINAQDILITGSTSEAYHFIFSLLKDKGPILLPLPTYPLFEDLATLSGCSMLFYKLEGAHWEPSLEDIEKGLKKGASSLVLISPNNPTGAVHSQKILEQIGLLAKKYQCSLIQDEVFDLFLYASPKLPRIAELCPQCLCFTLNGISKRFASADLKLGWIGVTGPEEERKEWVEKLEYLNDTFLSANALAQFILPQLFENARLAQSHWLALLEENRRILNSWKAPHGLELHIPRGGIHFLLEKKSTPKDDEKLAIELLKSEKIFLHPGYLYRFPEDGFLVATLLHPRAVFIEALHRLKTFFSAS